MPSEKFIKEKASATLMVNPANINYNSELYPLHDISICLPNLVKF